MESARLELPQGAVNLDTVRSLHQTVVSLRTALELCKSELKELKDKYQKQSDCSSYVDVIEKLTIENHILRRKVIDSGIFNAQDTFRNINLQVTYSPNLNESREVIIKSATPDVDKEIHSELKGEHSKSQEGAYASLNIVNKPAEDLNDSELERHVSDVEIQESEVLDVSDEIDEPPAQVEESGDQVNDPEVEFLEEDLNLNLEKSFAIDEDTSTSTPQEKDSEEDPSQTTISKLESKDDSTFKTKLEFLSKFDVRIKVRTLKEGVIPSSTTSDTDSTSGEKKDNEKPKTKDSSNKVHFEENKSFAQETKHFEEVKNLEIDNTSVKVVSVSTENIKMAVPNEAEVKNKNDKFDVQVRITSEENLVVKEGNMDRSRRKETTNLDVDDLSYRSLSEGDNSVFTDGATSPTSRRAPQSQFENEGSGNESEEVDDIELIFTTDESKDMSQLQEDLVSIREGDWAPSPISTTHSTPVLIKFHTLDPDFQPLDSKTETVKNKSQPLLQKRVSLPNDKEIKRVFLNGKSLDLPGRGILKSCDNRSDNILNRRSPNTSNRRLDSVDSLSCDYTRGLSFDTKSSSYELGSSLDVLQSVDSFQKCNHLGHRFSVFAENDMSKCGISEDDLVNTNLRRNTCPNPFQYRPALLPPRPPHPPPRPALRVSAAPRRDGAAQTDVTALPSCWTSDGYLAHHIPSALTPRPMAPRPAPSRRQLLSDIGFTSMVPELSRSADPVWEMEQRAAVSKYLSRGSSRSPSSVDRSYEWITQAYNNKAFRSSLPDVRGDDTDELLQESAAFLRRSSGNLLHSAYSSETVCQLSRPYLPSEPRALRLGHYVKMITPTGRIAVGKVRYVGLAGSSASEARVVVGAEVADAGALHLPINDGLYRGRRYFLAPPSHTAIFVPFHKVVMAWAN